MFKIKTRYSVSDLEGFVIHGPGKRWYVVACCQALSFMYLVTEATKHPDKNSIK